MKNLMFMFGIMLALVSCNPAGTTEGTDASTDSTEVVCDTTAVDTTAVVEDTTAL